MSMSRLILPFALFLLILFSAVTFLTVLYGASLPSWAIVYRQFVSPETGWRLVKMDAYRGVYADLLSVPTPASSNIISISPNHRYVVGEIVRNSSSRFWIIHDVNTGERGEFLVDFASPPAWSADSRYVAYTAIDRLTIIDAHNLASEPVQIVMGEDSNVTRFLWEEDSHTLQYWLYQLAEPRVSIIHADVRGTTIDQMPIEVDTFNVTMWSPSGRWLVYRNADPDLLDLLIVDVNSGETSAFVEMPFSDMGFSVYWSHDEEQAIVAFFEGSNSASLYRVDVDRGTYEQIWEVPDTLGNLYWSPNNAYVGVVSFTRNNIQSVNISILDANNNYAEVQSFIGGTTYLHWSPDSSQVIYTDLRGRLTRLDVESGEIHPLTDERFTRWLLP